MKAPLRAAVISRKYPGMHFVYRCENEFPTARVRWMPKIKTWRTELQHHSRACVKHTSLARSIVSDHENLFDALCAAMTHTPRGRVDLRSTPPRALTLTDIQAALFVPPFQP